MIREEELLPGERRGEFLLLNRRGVPAEMGGPERGQGELADLDGLD